MVGKLLPPPDDELLEDELLEEELLELDELDDEELELLPPEDELLELEELLDAAPPELEEELLDELLELLEALPAGLALSLPPPPPPPQAASRVMSAAGIRRSVVRARWVELGAVMGGFGVKKPLILLDVTQFYIQNNPTDCNRSAQPCRLKPSSKSRL